MLFLKLLLINIPQFARFMCVILSNIPPSTSGPRDFELIGHTEHWDCVRDV